MRKICALLSGCLLLFTLGGCGGGEGPTSSITLAESAQSQLEAAASELEVMTVEETVEYFKRLSPQVLGLEGKTLAEYEVFHNQASIPVNGLPCLEISVYHLDEDAHTNEAVGTYLLARDGTALYQLEPETDKITPLEF